MNHIIIIPAYNEEANIQKVINDIKHVVPHARIVAVDDGSTDNTVEVASQAGAIVISHPFNLGYGAALQTGYKYALRKGYDCVVQMDGDGQHDPSYTPRLLEVIEKGEADVSIGSRFMGEGEYRTGFIRRLGMKIFNILTSLVTNTKLTDSTSGYQALSRNILRFYVSNRYPVDFPDADVLIMLHRSGFKIKEVPVRMYSKKNGKSMHSGLKPIYYIFKMFLSIILTMLRRERFTKED